jgi:uncharacterized repeat protein (TIGR03847 family)
MNQQTLDLGLVSSLHAEAFGEPGQRTFRLLIEVSNGKVSLWLEKEQIVILSSATAELMRRVPADQGDDPVPSQTGDFSGDLEVSVGELGIGYDAERAGFTVHAQDLEAPFDLSAIHLLAARKQFEMMHRQLDQIVAAGRPRCVLCGTPLAGKAHFCPPSNGHGRVSHVE